MATPLFTSLFFRKAFFSLYYVLIQLNMKRCSAYNNSLLKALIETNKYPALCSDKKITGKRFFSNLEIRMKIYLIMTKLSKLFQNHYLNMKRINDRSLERENVSQPFFQLWCHFKSLRQVTQSGCYSRNHLLKKGIAVQKVAQKASITAILTITKKKIFFSFKGFNRKKLGRAVMGAK